MPEKIELPPKYYLEYFEYLLNFVRKKYAGILNENELFFLSEFENLSEDEQCLFIRFTNRRGAFFRSEKLKYAEILEIPQVIDSLISKNFIEALSHAHFPFAAEVLDIYNKTELISLAKMLNLDTKGKTSLKKEEVLDWLLENSDFEEIVHWLNHQPASVIKVKFETEVMMLKFLFFGSRYGDMTEFVVRDLGFQTYEKYDEEKMVAFFSTRQEAEDKFRVSIVREDFYLMQQSEVDPKDIFSWFIDWAENNSKELAEVARPSFERLVLKIGAFLEKQKLSEEALMIFRLTEEAPSRERQVRILHKLKNIEEARALCDQILLNPQNADEQFFAVDFINKLESVLLKKRAKKTVTRQLHSSESISLEADWKRRVELGVIDYYEKRGRKAAFTENHLWRSFFGLLFWDIIFDTETLAIHHPLQRSPSDLFKPNFFEKRKSKMEERLEIFEDKEEAQQFIYTIFFEKYGITNPLVDWYGGLFPLLVTLVEKLNAEQISTLMLEMARNLKENIRGFPDLLIWDDGDYCFIEVKSPTDNLSSQQLYWLRFFEEHRIKAKVLRVEWEKPEADEEPG
ncbi:VRR-NUC domain-containing protein [Pseudarcicella hirudinis]|uniref:phosphodiesterase I n=1 Tax=Pseudarcicella hirudinis TaxID=1079859 RepID=A0A1I5S0Z2_9BACT|nr:VRR-NUC domain-containing protein [Pseudarcicella hirudinis]SFP64410.1 VRR-NUC domain-containing protein [Pseudarcicella hirudinis]